MAKLTLFEKLEQIEARYNEMTRELSSPEVHADSARYQKLAKTHAELGEIVDKYREWKEIEKGSQGAKQMFAESDDAEMKQMAHDEQRDLEARSETVEREVETAARAQGSERRKKRDPRNSRRNRRRRGLAFCRRAFSHVFALCGIAGLARGDPRKLRLFDRRHEGSGCRDSGKQSVLEAEVRKRRASRAARAGNRAARPHSHFRRNGGGAS